MNFVILFITFVFAKMEKILIESEKNEYFDLK
jgi:hypothetical protein